ncbi:hypothetical protein, partial [Escherichia coli]|nr:hypothetical protein [Escherichia coli]MUN18082.1 hypothetical protein [Escherichia coli]
MVLIGVTSSMTSSGNNWVVTTQDFLGQQPQNDFDKTITYTSGTEALQWKYDAANGTGTLTQGNTSWDMHGKKGNDLNAGKNLLFTGNKGEVVLNRPGFPGECFICELRLPDHRFRWKHNKLFLLLPEEYGPAF